MSKKDLYKFTIQYNNDFVGSFYGHIQSLHNSLQKCPVNAEYGIKRILAKSI